MLPVSSSTLTEPNTLRPTIAGAWTSSNMFASLDVTPRPRSKSRSNFTSRGHDERRSRDSCPPGVGRGQRPLRECGAPGKDHFVDKELVVMQESKRDALVQHAALAFLDRCPFGAIGFTPRMEAVFTFIERAARVNASVLVVGESGTGKELVARAIHARSDRSRQPFLALNCAALPGPLLESTLFGAEKGAFTGADRRTKGYFEAAEGGALMLDEIGDTSLEFQVKLLRVLEEGKVTRLGGTEPIRTNARVNS